MKSGQILLTILLVLLPFNLVAQEAKDSIFVKKAFFGKYKFIQNNVGMSIYEVMPVMRNSPEAFALIVRAERAKNWYWGLSLTAGALIFTQIVFFHEPQPLLISAFWLANIPAYIFFKKYGKYAYDAANAYNLGLKNTSAKVYFHMGIAPNGVGVVVRF